jgi:hypothetical protein
MKRAMWDAACKLPTQVADERSRSSAKVEIADVARAADMPKNE